ncbi:hypothetical protein Mal35_57510 [Gimesia maris]|nr:hypothetical protein Mal35_57510 [Gimesia maris]
MGLAGNRFAGRWWGGLVCGVDSTIRSNDLNLFNPDQNIEESIDISGKHPEKVRQMHALLKQYVKEGQRKLVILLEILKNQRAKCGTSIGPKTKPVNVAYKHPGRD